MYLKAKGGESKKESVRCESTIKPKRNGFKIRTSCKIRLCDIYIKRIKSLLIFFEFFCLYYSIFPISIILTIRLIFPKNKKLSKTEMLKLLLWLADLK